MSINNKIHDFALLWINKFKDVSSTGNELAGDVSFADACFSFGFYINNVDSFFLTYDLKSLDDKEEFKKDITKVEDIKYWVLQSLVIGVIIIIGRIVMMK